MIAARTFAALAVGFAAAAPLAAPGVLPIAAAGPCPDVELVFARGTNEGPGLGRVGQALADTLGPQLGNRSLGVYPVNYPATYDFLTAADGATDATNHIAAMAADCPNTRIALGGFSQGAAVVSMLAGVSPIPLEGAARFVPPSLSPDLARKVAAVTVFGNPASEQGRPLTTTGIFAGRAMDVCDPGDPVCAGGDDVNAHRTYELGPGPADAANFIAARV